MTSLGEGKQKEDLAQIIALLKNEFEHIDASSVGNDVEATASSQAVHVVEPESDSLSLSSEDDDFSKLEGDDPARVSSDSPSFEVIDDEAEVSAPKMPLATERAEAEPDNLNEEKDDQQNLTVPTVSSSVSENIGSNSASEAGSLDDDEDYRNYYYGLDPDVNNDQEQDIQSEALASEFKIENVNNDINVNQPTGHVEQVAHGNGQPKTELPGINEQSSESKSKAAPQNTTKYVVAAAALTIAGIVSGVAVAVYLEMLAVGVAVAACCLIAATVIYSCGPKSSLEDNEVEEVDVMQKSTPCYG